MQVVLNAKEFKSMFSTLRPILRNAADGGLLGFSVSQHVLSVTCRNGVIFEQKFACEQDGPMFVTVLYRDISDLLPGTGEVYVDLSEKLVHIKADGFTTTLLSAYGQVSPYRKRVQNYKQCDAKDYLRLARAFQELNAVAKTLKRDAPVLLVPPRAICKYPTVWLEVAYRGISTSMGMKDLRTIANFEPKLYGVAEDAIEFLNGSALLAYPLNKVGECKTCKDILVNPSEPKTLHVLESVENIQAMTRVVRGPCKVSFYTDGYIVSYKNNEVEMSVSAGPCTGRCLYTLDTYTEYLMMIFHLIGESKAQLVVGDNAVMLEAPGKLRLLHSIV